MAIQLMYLRRVSFSSADEVVQPMAGTGASAYILDARNVGTSNNQIQTVCNGKVAGVFATHESVLYHPLAYALAVDALTHPGAGQASRLDSDTICDSLVSPGLSVADIIATEGNHDMFSRCKDVNGSADLSLGNIPISAVAIALYGSKMVDEPALMAYATY